MKTVSFFKHHTVSQPVIPFPVWTALQHSAVRTLQTQTRKRDVLRCHKQILFCDILQPVLQNAITRKRKHILLLKQEK